MIEERLMAAGRFDDRVRDGTPYTVREQLTEWGLWCYTRTRLDGTPSAADVIAQSMFTGVVRVIEDDMHAFSGASAAILAGDEDDKGHTLGGDAFITGTDTLADIVTALCQYTNGITPGQVKATTGAAFLIPANPDVPQTPRKWLDYAMSPGAAEGWGSIVFGAFAGLEYRINPNLTLDVDDGSALFTVNPTVLITDHGTSAEGMGHTVIAADIRVTTADVEDWISGCSIIDQNSDTPPAERGDADLSPNPYKNPAGADLQMRRLEWQDQGDGEADLDARAGQIVARESRVIKGLDVTTDVDVRRHVQPGDNIYVHKPSAKLVDLDNELNVHGRLINPQQLRVFAIRYPRPPGAGVYHLTPTSPQVVVDLTDHVEPETGPTTLEVARIPRGVGALIEKPWFPPSL